MSTELNPRALATPMQRRVGPLARPRSPLYSFSRCVWYCWKKDCSTRSNSDSTGVGVRPPTSQSHTQPPKRQVCHYAARGHPRFMTSTTTYPMMMSISARACGTRLHSAVLHRFVSHMETRIEFALATPSTKGGVRFDQRECGTW
jgi:hypothetical protein